MSHIPASMQNNMTVLLQEYPALKSEMPLVCPSTFKRVHQRLIGKREGSGDKAEGQTK